jgi:hypothetical protein
MRRELVLNAVNQFYLLRTLNWRNWDINRNLDENSHGFPRFLLRSVFLGYLPVYAVDDGTDSRLRPLLDIRWRRGDLLQRCGVGINFVDNTYNRLIGGASCMCIAMSVAELVSAYPVRRF